MRQASPCHSAAAASASVHASALHRAGVAAPAPSLPDHIAMLAALCDKSLLCSTRYEELHRWLPSWSVGRIYRVLHGLEAQGLVLRAPIGWRAGDEALVRLRAYERRAGVRAVEAIHAAIAAAESERAARANERP